MKYLFALIFILVFIFFDNSIGYTNTSPTYTHLTYMFQHSNIIHLIINSFAFIGMFRVMERFVNKWTLPALIILTAFASSFLSMYDIPTVGASGMIYAMIGMFFGLIISGEAPIKIDKKKMSMFIFMVLFSLIISFFKQNSNFVLHIYCMIIGAYFQANYMIIEWMVKE